ncbi:MAG TPA: hypothetical protein DCS07_16365 [Bdellovibrionales bacterium]|nr:MAG: hypothetical protein A2Z97_16605 [Bdellovibrionales bacterium GWB1_52_6]OFZ05081.1 MAG: hypothetical protein A2X97_00625 [Bdellovibrionales bacterium GWA1_52_35]OFZ40576.1 MAG: hypothetical protein A2070_11265 [Bdellovibrionales bacterium GWC1_52_8]HAR44179.1 hypothetical protein [Bdellovibrionales bacterium]HCM41319.1 hypothetical protein [Bdellovibrionales bacterium]
MPLDSDVVLLGTGVASLVAANQLVSQGYSVLLLNPDDDFFQEDSELSLDPLWPLTRNTFNRDRLLLNLPENAIAQLRPSFPGAVEYWSEKGSTAGFHDPAAPQLRQRSRLWVVGPESPPDQWDLFESLFIDGGDWGLKPQILDGVQAVGRFPGMAKIRNADHSRGLLLPSFCEFDVVNYREGLLEFLSERLGPERLICGAGQIELMPGGIRFTTGDKHYTARIHEGMLVFWTSRLNQWVLAKAKEVDRSLPLPDGIRLWEEWSLASRDKLDAHTIGTYRDMTVWAESSEGRELHRLSVLLAGPLLQFKEPGLSWADAHSFERLSSLCEFLNWESFAVRSMRHKAMFEWAKGSPAPFVLSKDPRTWVVAGCDGSLVDIVRRARSACTSFQEAREGNLR